jgi:hypothetical protein
MSLTESILEDAALTWFGELGYAVGHRPQMAPGELEAEWSAFGEVVLVEQLCSGDGGCRPDRCRWRAEQKGGLSPGAGSV